MSTYHLAEIALHTLETAELIRSWMLISITSYLRVPEDIYLHIIHETWFEA